MSTLSGGQGNIVTNGLVLRLDAANPRSYQSGSLIWNDLSGNGNNGTLTNGPAFTISGSGAIVFDGYDDFISTDLIPTIGTGSITYSVWFKTSATQTGGLIGVRNGSAIQVVLVMSNSTGTGAGTNLLAYSYDGSTIRSSATTKTWGDNNWHQAVMVYTSTTSILYVDGVLEVQSTGTALNVNNSTKLLVGCNPNGNTYLGSWVFNGSISNSLVYNRALSQSEITQNFNATRARFGV